MRLSQKKIRLLELLGDQISECKNCMLHEGGKSLPYWTPISCYIIIGEAPGKEEVDTEPFIGSAGKRLWESMSEFGYRKEQFAIINSVQCRPVKGGRNGKPSKKQCQRCYPWIRKFIKIIEPEKILILGNYAMATMLGGEPKGITSVNGNEKVIYGYEPGNIPAVLSVHPAVCIYNGEDGKKDLLHAIENFSKVSLGEY